MNRNDLRFIKTEDLIRKAFLACAAENDFENIRIKDICNHARISRNAFYAHYADKYELLDKIIIDLEDSLKADMTPLMLNNIHHHQFEESTKWAVNVISDHREILQVLAKTSPQLLRQLVHDVFIEGPLSEIYENTDEIKNDVTLRMAYNAISEMLSGSILVWLQDMDAVSKEEMKSFIEDFLHEPVSILYQKLDRHPGMVQNTAI